MALPSRDALIEELRTTLLSGLVEPWMSQGEALVPTLADDWLREAGAAPDPTAVLTILRDDLAGAVAGGEPEDRLDRLRHEVLIRRVRAAGRRSFDLAKQAIDGAIDDNAARAAGEDLITELHALSLEVRTQEDPQSVRVLTTALEPAQLEALYLLERKAMSRRLDSYARSKGAAPDSPTPPDIRRR